MSIGNAVIGREIRLKGKEREEEEDKKELF